MKETSIYEVEQREKVQGEKEQCEKEHLEGEQCQRDKHVWIYLGVLPGSLLSLLQNKNTKSHNMCPRCPLIR